MKYALIFTLIAFLYPCKSFGGQGVEFLKRDGEIHVIYQDQWYTIHQDAVQDVDWRGLVGQGLNENLKKLINQTSVFGDGWGGGMFGSYEDAMHINHTGKYARLNDNVLTMTSYWICWDEMKTKSIITDAHVDMKSVLLNDESKGSFLKEMKDGDSLKFVTGIRVPGLVLEKK